MHPAKIFRSVITGVAIISCLSSALPTDNANEIIAFSADAIDANSPDLYYLDIDLTNVPNVVSEIRCSYHFSLLISKYRIWGVEGAELKKLESELNKCGMFGSPLWNGTFTFGDCLNKVIRQRYGKAAHCKEE